MIVSVNPTTGQEIARLPEHDDREVEAVLAAAAAAQAEWAMRPVSGRVSLLSRLAEGLREGKARYARLIMTEMGKPIVEAEAEVEKCALACDFYAEKAAAFLADQEVASNAARSAVVFDPLGVILAIMPWNYPFWQVFRFAAPALAAGNGIILKHAANVPQCALAIEAILKDAGCPAGLFGVLMVPPEQVAGLIADHRIAAITLTGSTEVGAIVAAQAGRALKKQVLELGGSDPFIVLADADVRLAAEVAVKARFINAGQSCVNAKRFIVEAQVADRFVEAFAEGIARLRVGDPLDRETTVGPMARANLRVALHDQVQRSVAAGADLRLGGDVVAGPGFFYQPTLLDHVTPGMAAFEEETFGPVAAVIRASDAQQAVALANRTEFGLGASIWTRDVERGAVLARRIQAGAVFVNGMVASDPRLPFGGVKRSGYGRELGDFGIREFVNVKTLWVGPARSPSRHPGRAAMTDTKTHPPAVLRPRELAPRERGGGARTIPLVNARLGSSKTLSGITEFDPGAAIALHVHNCEETVLVLEGEAVAEIDGQAHALQPTDTTWIPAGTPHRFRNPSATARLRIYWTYASVDATRTVIATGVTTRIDEEHGVAPD